MYYPRSNKVFGINVDDSEVQAKLLHTKLVNWAKQSGQVINIDVFHEPESFLGVFRESSMWNILMLDISKPQMSGIELATQIRSIDTLVPIIFISNFIEFSMQGYIVGATRYIHKDADNFDDNLYESLSAVIRILNSRTDEKITVSVGNGLQRISYNDILYFESERHYIRVYTFESSYTDRNSIKQLMKVIPTCFVPCSRSILVNTNHIDAVMENSVLLSNGKVLNMSRRFKNTVMQSFATLT